ncbi:MAG: hypothetical protein ACLTZT_02585 [Butyricimonas faecalis]
MSSIGGNKLVGECCHISAGVAYAPTIEICLYGWTKGMIDKYARDLKEVEQRKKVYLVELMKQTSFGYGYGWQKWVRSTAIDESATYYYETATKNASLLQRRVASANAPINHITRLCCSLCNRCWGENKFVKVIIHSRRRRDSTLSVYEADEKVRFYRTTTPNPSLHRRGNRCNQLLPCVRLCKGSWRVAFTLRNNFCIGLVYRGVPQGEEIGI